MIYNNLKNITMIKGLDENIIKVLEYTILNNLKNYKKGSYEIDGRNLFFNRVSYETKEDKDGFWEGHRDYIDIHIILDGKERIDYNLMGNLEPIDYKKEGDFASFKGNKKQSLILEKDDFVVFYPEDIHMTGLNVCNTEEVNKVIFKVLI